MTNITGKNIFSDQVGAGAVIERREIINLKSIQMN